MAAGTGVAIVALAVGCLLNLLPINDPNALVRDALRGQNPSDMALYSAFAAFLAYIAGIVLLYWEVLTR